MAQKARCRRNDGQEIRRQGRRGQMVSHMGEKRVFPRRARQGRSLFGGHSAAERHGHSPHGPRAQPDHPGRSRQMAAHVRLQHALAAGHGSRRHRHAERRGEGFAQRGQAQAGSRARGVRCARVGVEEAVRRHDRPPAEDAGQLHGLAARTLYVRRRMLPRRGEGLHAALRRGVDIQGQLHRQLVSALRHRSSQRRGRA